MANRVQKPHQTHPPELTVEDPQDVRGSNNGFPLEI
jgi:hypothetical protein